MFGGISVKLEGARINFLGDSITDIFNATAPDKVYHQLIKRDYGLAAAYNYGVSGTRIARQTNPTIQATKQDLTFELRAQTMCRDVDAVVVFGGTNDYGHGDSRFGGVDSEDEDIYTFCGAVNSLITALKRDFPTAELVFMTPLHRRGEEEPRRVGGEPLANYAHAIAAICARRGVKVIDLFAVNPIDPADADLLPDGLHPSDAGHALLAQTVGQALLAL